MTDAEDTAPFRALWNAGVKGYVRPNRYQQTTTENMILNEMVVAARPERDKSDMEWLLYCATVTGVPFDFTILVILTVVHTYGIRVDSTRLDHRLLKRAGSPMNDEKSM
jgi:hypothetical protein